MFDLYGPPYVGQGSLHCISSFFDPLQKLLQPVSFTLYQYAFDRYRYNQLQQCSGFVAGKKVVSVSRASVLSDRFCDATMVVEQTVSLYNVNRVTFQA